jgi:hypothetical protein
MQNHANDYGQKTGSPLTLLQTPQEAGSASSSASPLTTTLSMHASTWEGTDRSQSLRGDCLRWDTLGLTCPPGALRVVPGYGETVVVCIGYS